MNGYFEFDRSIDIPLSVFKSAWALTHHLP